MAKASLTPGVIELNDSTLPQTREDIRLDQLLPPDILNDRTKLREFLEAYYTFLNLDEFIYQETETFSDVILDGVARFRIPDANNENDRFFTDESGASSVLTLTSPTGNSPAEFEFNGSSSSAVSISGDHFIIGNTNQKACPVGTALVYDTGDGTAIAPLVDDNTYYVVFSNSGQIQISETLGGTAINLTSLGTGTKHSFKGPASTMTIPLTATNVAISNGNELPGTLAESTSEIGKTFTVTDLASFNGYSASLSTIVKYWVGPGPSHVINTIERAMDIDNNATNYLELMQKEIAPAIPRDVTANKRSLYKRMVDFYKLRGTSDSIEIFFRLIFNDTVEVEFPYDSVLVPSSGQWDQPATVDTTTAAAVNNSTTITIPSFDENIRLGAKLVVSGKVTLVDDNQVTAVNGTTITVSSAVTLTSGEAISFVPRGTYLDNKGFLSYNIKLQDSYKWQKFSYIIKTGKNLSDWEYIFDKLVHPAGFIYFAEILVFIQLTDAALTAALNKVSMPTNQPGVIGPEDIPLLVEMFVPTFLPGTQARIHKSGTLSLSLKNGVINTVTVTTAGSGYLTAPTVSSGDTGTPSEHVPGTFTAVLSNGGVGSVTISDGGKDYNVPIVSFAAPPRIQFDGSDDEVAGTGIVNTTDNTIKLTTAQAAALPIGAKVTYDSGGALAIGGLVTGTEYFIVYNTNNEVKLSATSGGSVISLTSVGGGTDHGFTGETAIATATKLDGVLLGVTIVEPGFGYSGAPSITFSGIEQSSGSGVAPVVSIGVDSVGRLDQDNITITSSGGGWTALFGTPAANPNAGEISSVDIFGLADKKYTSAPNIVFPEPTSKDAEGNPLSTNVRATANFTLDSEGEITGVNITNAGSGYVNDPVIKLGSAVHNEQRVADQQEILILALNHNNVDDMVTGFQINPRQSTGSIMTSTGNPDKFLSEHRVDIVNPNWRTIINNGYLQRKGTNNLYSTPRLYHSNQQISFLGDKQIQTLDNSDINKYNVRSFVHIE